MTNQNDFVIDNGTGLAVRTDIQDALQALAGNSSGNSEPSVKYAYQWWADTNAGILKLRNSSNDGWIDMLNLDGSFVFDLEDGTAAAPSLRLADDQDTGIFSPGSNAIALTTGGSKCLTAASNKVLINSETEGHPDADDLTIEASSGYAGITLRAGTTDGGAIYFSDATSGTGEYVGQVLYSHNTNTLVMVASGSQQLELSDGVARFYGKILVGTGTTGHADADDLTLESSSGYTGITLRAGSTQGGAIYFSDATSGAGEYDGQLLYSHNSQKMFIIAGGLVGFEVHSSRDCEVTDGNLVFGSSGHGISFINAADTATGETTSSSVMDDYEEGSFDVNYKTGSAGGNTVSSASYASTGGLYTKIGDMVHFQIRINCSSSNALGGQIVIQGLPYTHLSTTIASGAYIVIGDMLGTTVARLHIDGTEIRFLTADGSSFGSGAGGVNLNTQFHCAGTYKAA